MPVETASSSDWAHPILTHFLETDPEGTLLASEDGEPIAIGSAVRRDDYWFLAFLFVLPTSQARGIGRMLLDRLVPRDPSVVRATVVESFQPVSTGLYASHGMVPVAIKYWLTGVRRPDALPRLPVDVARTSIAPSDVHDIGAMDRSLLGFERAADHRWFVEAGSTGWAYRRGDDLIAYAYVEDSYVGPVLARDEQTLCEVVGGLVREADDAASMSVHLTGSSGALFRTLVQAGAKIDESSDYRFVYCSSDGPLPASYVHHASWLP